VAQFHPTQRQIAEEAGVSRTTVSFVLNEVPGVRISLETRQRVLEVAQRLNYYPDAMARRLASGKSRIIAVVWHQGPDQSYQDAFLPGALRGITRAAYHYGYHILFRPIEPDEPCDGYMDLARGRHADGIIVSGPRSDDACLAQLHREHFPLVLHGQLDDPDIPSADVDNARSAAMAVEHLLSLGHRRIGTITNAPLAYMVSRQRLEGYRQTLEQADILYDESLVQLGDFDEESGRAAMERLLDQAERPTAIFAASDAVAMGALWAIHDRGLRVPEDIAVIGFDDIPAARFVTPPLTTIRVPSLGLGWSAAELLIRLIEQDIPQETHVLLETELMVRESCGASLRQ